MNADALDIWLDGHFAGKLMRGISDQVEFAYDSNFLDVRSTPLSVSMPTSVQSHGPKSVMPS